LHVHIYHVASGTPVMTILRPARTPKGTEVRTVIKHVTKRLRRHWPKTRIVWRGDSHYGRVEAMEWAEDNDEDYIFGLAGNSALDALVAETATYLRFHHALSRKTKLRTFASFMYQAGSWKRPRKVVARLECSLQPVTGETGMRQEVDIRYVVTSLKGPAQHLYENVYCQRGQMENLIKLHKAQLASDRMSCHSAAFQTVNAMRSNGYATSTATLRYGTASMRWRSSRPCSWTRSRSSASHPCTVRKKGGNNDALDRLRSPRGLNPCHCRHIVPDRLRVRPSSDRNGIA
jgi:Transposase DDE domain group 1